MKSFLLILGALLLLPTASWAGAYAKGGGGGGATEHSGTVTRPLNGSDSFVVGTHGSPEITLDPTSKSISIAAGTAGQCNTLKEKSASGSNKLDTCVADTLSADYTCTFEDGEWIGAGCPAPLGYAVFELSADDTLPWNAGAGVHPTWTIADSGGSSVGLLAGWANYVTFSSDGVYEITATFFGVTTSTIVAMVPSFVLCDGSTVIVEQSYSPDPGFPVAGGTTIAYASTVTFHGIISVTGHSASTCFAMQAARYTTGEAPRDVNIFVKPNTSHTKPITIMVIKKLR